MRISTWRFLILIILSRIFSLLLFACSSTLRKYLKPLFTDRRALDSPSSSSYSLFLFPSVVHFPDRMGLRVASFFRQQFPRFLHLLSSSWRKIESDPPIINANLTILIRPQDQMLRCLKLFSKILACVCGFTALSVLRASTAACQASLASVFNGSRRGLVVHP